MPRFVQDYICQTWQKKIINDVEEFEKPQEIKSATRWDQIKSEMFEREEIIKQDNTFNKNNHYQEYPSSRFRPNFYKPKEKPKFDLAKETAKNSFPDLN